jgi:hypothetical protein
MILYVAGDCAGCLLQPRCTTAERRFVSCHQHEDALERMNARFHADPSLIRQRQYASEHPFGTIKRMTAGGRSSPVDLEKSVVKQRSACSPTISSGPSISSAPQLSRPKSHNPIKRGSRKEPPAFHTACSCGRRRCRSIQDTRHLPQSDCRSRSRPRHLKHSSYQQRNRGSHVIGPNERFWVID